MVLQASILKMDQRSIVFYLNMKDLLLIDIQRDRVETLAPEVVAYSPVTRYRRAWSFREPN
jgi:hypothetical protein